VVELGVVLAVLMGWQFAAAEFVGGPIMIALLALTGGFVLRRGLAERARARLQSGAIGGHDHAEMVGVSEERQAELERMPWGRKLRSQAAWSDSASYTFSDINMLRKELVIGYLVAGFLTILVPMNVWNDVFLKGHGFWTSLENVVVGPFIAFISFVCSIGNVPMAAALWHGGISFGGVVSFIFADLIATGGIPADRPENFVTTHFKWNYTTFLNIAALALFAFLYALYRNRERHGGSREYAIDPVCGMQVERANAPARAIHEGHTYSFCADRCRERFEREPDRYTAKPTPSPDPRRAR
jgi:hypothetical protein